MGHDWGGNHVVTAVNARPELVRSWVTDTIGAFDPEYEWHALAQVWQTPGAGERSVAERFATVDAKRAALVGRGFPEDLAAEIAAGRGSELGEAVLALYRSAVQPVPAELGRDLSGLARRPGLAVVAGADEVVGTLEQRRRHGPCRCAGGGAPRAGALVDGAGSGARGPDALGVLVEPVLSGAPDGGPAGLTDGVFAVGLHMITVPLWFVGVYLAIVLAAPAMMRLHQRHVQWPVLGRSRRRWRSSTPSGWSPARRWSGS